MRKCVYFDNSATTYPYKEVITTMKYIMEKKYGNASSTHFKGLEAQGAIESVRDVIRNSLSVDQGRIFFTSGGTEANNMAVLGAAMSLKHRGNHLITTSIEHSSVLECYKFLENNGFIVDYIPVNRYGFIDLAYLKNAIRKDTVLISIMHTNNEIGTVQDLDRIVKIIKEINKDTIIHVDAVQSYGKIPIYPGKSNIDLLTISAHKIHGPKGVGALYENENINIKPILFGGGQEYNIRPGTENVAGICGFGKAIEITFGKNAKERIQYIRDLRDKFIALVQKSIPNIIINSPVEDCYSNKSAAPHILSILINGIKSRELSDALSRQKICISTKSACSSNTKSHSHVLQALGMNYEQIESTIRVSFSVFNTESEIKYAVNCLRMNIDRLKCKNN